MLPPIFVLSKPKLTAATSDPDSIAAQFATVELFKTKIHLLAGETILNTDGENHHFGYESGGWQAPTTRLVGNDGKWEFVGGVHPTFDRREHWGGRLG